MTPHTASLMLRGMRTLPLRMERLSTSANTVAEYFNTIPSIRKVNFPGLSTHPQHKLADSQMSGCGSLMSIELKGTLEQARAWVDQLRYFRIGLSFGGYESLVLVVGLVPEASQDNPVVLIRFSIGLEDPVDLIEDLNSIHQLFPLNIRNSKLG